MHAVSNPHPGLIITALLAELSRSDRAVADVVLADTPTIPTLTITQLAGRAGVSPPTVTRFCRKVGFASFQDFKLALAQIPPGRVDDLAQLDDPAAMADE